MNLQLRSMISFQIYPSTLFSILIVHLFLLNQSEIKLLAIKTELIQFPQALHFQSQISKTTTISTLTNRTLLHDPCARLPLTPDLWRELQLDHYLQNYPSAQTLALEVNFTYILFLP